MKFLPLFLLLCLISCQNNSNCTADTLSMDKEESKVAECPVPAQNLPGKDESDHVADADVPQEAYMFDANILFTNFEVEDEDKVYKAVEIIKKVIRSQKFKDEVINFSYKGKKQFIDTKLSNRQVYEKLLKGSEDLSPEVDHEMDLDLELYYTSRNTVGYTYPGGLRIWMNRKYFDSYTPAQVAGNIFHEWTHKLGFKHAYNYTASRDHSVPYAIGYLIRDLGKKYQ